MSKDRIVEMLDQAILNILDAKNIMDDNRHFHTAGGLEVCSKLMSEIIRSIQVQY